MAKTKLFESLTFRLQLPPPFDDPKYSGAKPMGFSQYNTSSTAQKATLHAPTLRALLAYAKLVSATENGQSVDDLGAIGHQGNTYRISEYRSANKTDCVVFNPVTGKFSAVQIEDGSQVLKPYSLGAGNGSGSALLFCLMPVLNEDDEFRQKFQEFTSHYENGWADMDAAFECALVLCDNVYRRIENSKQLGTDGVKISIPTTGNISVITQMAMDSGNYAPTGASYGNFTIMQLSGNATAKATSFQKEDFVGKYALSNRILTDREKAMVPTLPDWYIIPKEVVRVCEHLHDQQETLRVYGQTQTCTDRVLCSYACPGRGAGGWYPCLLLHWCCAAGLLQRYWRQDHSCHSESLPWIFPLRSQQNAERSGSLRFHRG